jgi:hypothetical protein
MNGYEQHNQHVYDWAAHEARRIVESDEWVRLWTSLYGFRRAMELLYEGREYGRRRESYPTHRMRRGELVEIPEEWQGKTLSSQTKRKRASKHIRKDRLRIDRWYPGPPHPRNQAPRHSLVVRRSERREERYSKEEGVSNEGTPR